MLTTHIRSRGTTHTMFNKGCTREEVKDDDTAKAPLNSRERLTATCSGLIDTPSSVSRNPLPASQPRTLRFAPQESIVQKRVTIMSIIGLLLAIIAILLRRSTPTHSPPTSSDNASIHPIVKALEARLLTIQEKTNEVYKRQNTIEAEIHEAKRSLVHLDNVVNDLVKEKHVGKIQDSVHTEDLTTPLLRFQHHIDRLDQDFQSLSLHLDSRLRTMETTYTQKLTNALSPEQHRRGDFHVKVLESTTRLQAEIDALYHSVYLDETGKVDWARASLGGSIDEEFTSAPRSYSFWNNLKWVLIFFFPRFYGKAQPRSHPASTVIGSLGHIISSCDMKTSYIPGHCFAFNGERGNITLRLPALINVTEVHIDHVNPHLLPSWGSAARRFKVYIDECMTEDCTRRFNFLHPPSIHVGTFEFNFPNQAQQTFRITQPQHGPRAISRRVRFEFLRNHGGLYTCIYRLRVHGEKIENYSKMRFSMSQGSRRQL